MKNSKEKNLTEQCPQFESCNVPICPISAKDKVYLKDEPICPYCRKYKKQGLRKTLPKKIARLIPKENVDLLNPRSQKKYLSEAKSLKS